MCSDKNQGAKHKEEQLVDFLKQTQSGKYAKIDKNSLPYSRLKFEREDFSKEEYYYSLR